MIKNEKIVNIFNFIKNIRPIKNWKLKKLYIISLIIFLNWLNQKLSGLLYFSKQLYNYKPIFNKLKFFKKWKNNLKNN